MLDGIGEQAVVIMWKKNDNKKRIIASRVSNLNLSKFDPERWSIIAYYNLTPSSRRPQEKSSARESSPRSQVPDDNHNSPTQMSVDEPVPSSSRSIPMSVDDASMRSRPNSVHIY